MTQSRRIFTIIGLMTLSLLLALGGLAVAEGAALRPVAVREADTGDSSANAIQASVPLTTPTLAAPTGTATPDGLPHITEFYLSASPDGTAQQSFPEGTSAVYVHYDYANFQTAHTVTVQLRDTYGLVFWRSDLSHTGAGTEVLTVTAQSVYQNYLGLTERAADQMVSDLTQAISSTTASRLQLYVSNALGASRDLDTALQQLIRYTPPAAIPQLADALGQLHDAQEAGVAAIQAGTNLSVAQQHARDALMHAQHAQTAIAAVSAAGPNAAVNSLPGTIDEPHIANIRIDLYPVETIEWVVQNPSVYRRLAAPLRRGVQNRLTIVSITNFSNSSANLTVQYFSRGSNQVLLTQSITLGGRNTTTINIQDLNDLPSNYDGYALVTADEPIGVAVSQRTPEQTVTPSPTITPGGPTSTSTPSPTRTLTPGPSPTSAASPTPSPSPTLCPQATPEALFVDPVTSPTELLSQSIKVYIGNGDVVTVTTVSGAFSAMGDFSTSNPASVNVTLLPNTTHDLVVVAHVALRPGPGGCTYGGYTLTTTRDRNGAPLTIVQQSPTLPPGVTPSPTATLKPETSTPTPTLVPTNTSTPTVTSTPTLTPTPTPATLLLTPAASGSGYVTSQDRNRNYFGTRILWTGIDSRPFTPVILHGAMQFDLSALPADAEIVSAEMTFIGTSSVYLDPGTGGNWRLRLLDESVDPNWTRLNYHHIHNAPVDATSPTVLRTADIATGRMNTFTLDATGVAQLHERLRTTRHASFRLDLEPCLVLAVPFSVGMRHPR